MERPDQLRQLFRLQMALNERIGVKTDGLSKEEKIRWILNFQAYVKKNEVNFKRQDTGYAQKDEHDSKPI